MDLPRGKITDYGDLLHEERWIIKGRHINFALHWGAETKALPEDHVADTTPATPAPRKALTIMDLHADKKRTVAATAVDEMGNPTSFAGTMAYAVDDPALVNLTDNGDGSAVVAAVGPVGVANLTFTATPDVGAPIERVEAINVIAGDAAAFDFTFGDEEEVTPDA